MGWRSSKRRGGGRKVRALRRKFVFLGFQREEPGMSQEFVRDVPDAGGCSKGLCKKKLCSSFSSLLSRARGRTATQRSKKGSEKVLGRVLESVLRRVLRSGLSTAFAVKKGPGWRGRWPRGGQRPRRNPQIQQLAMTEHSRTTHARCARSSCNKRQKARELRASFSEITAISVLVSPRHRSSDIDLVSI